MTSSLKRAYRSRSPGRKTPSGHSSRASRSVCPGFTPAARASLLAAGVTGVTGTFEAGDPVDLTGPDGIAVARGLVNFDATEIPDLVGRSTHELKRELGSAYEREVVHRDDLVLL